MRNLTDADAESVEDHIAFCSHCLDRLDETTAYVEGMRIAVKPKPAPEPQSSRLPKWLIGGWRAPIWGAGLVATAVLVFFAVRVTPRPESLAAAAMVILDGTRGSSTVVHGAGPFDFELFMPAAGANYHVELLDDGGQKRWEANVPGNNGKLHAVIKQRLMEGQYYLHVTEPASGYAHDYAVRVAQ